MQALLAGLDAYPAYYAHMGPANLAGPGGADLSPPEQATPDEIRRRIAAGEWVLDLRDRAAFASGFVPGTICFPLNGSFASYLGWVLPWGTPVTLLGETATRSPGPSGNWRGSGSTAWPGPRPGSPGSGPAASRWRRLRLATFGDLARAGGRRVVLDVRRDLEWADGHVDGALHIPFSDLPRRVADIPEGEIWVYCRTGYRAVVAASILAAAGRQVISIDDEFDHAHDAGLTLMRPGGEPEERPR